MAKMATKSGAGSISFDGVEYPVVDGVVDVPDEAAVELVSHGFEYAPAEAEVEVVQGLEPKEPFAPEPESEPVPEVPDEAAETTPEPEVESDPKPKPPKRK